MCTIFMHWKYVYIFIRGVSIVFRCAENFGIYVYIYMNELCSCIVNYNSLFSTNKRWQRSEEGGESVDCKE